MRPHLYVGVERTTGIAQTRCVRRRTTITTQIAALFPYPGEHVEAAGELVFLPDLDSEDWRRVVSYAERLRFSSGDTIIEAGELDRSLYIIVEGRVEVLLPTPTGELRRYGTIEQSVTGEIAFLDGGPRTATIRALGEVELLRLSFESWEVLSARNPDLGRAILFDLARILAVRLRAADAALGRAKGS
jgi:CRP/FNR family cyclic AMP-dependent transcriptional regulator